MTNKIKLIIYRSCISNSFPPVFNLSTGRARLAPFSTITPPAISPLPNRPERFSTAWVILGDLVFLAPRAEKLGARGLRGKAEAMTRPERI